MGQFGGNPGGKFNHPRTAKEQAALGKAQAGAPGAARPGSSAAAAASGGAADPAGAAATGSTTTTQVSPYLTSQIKRYEDRFKSDPTENAIRRSTQGTMDAAALATADAKGSLSSRGVLGTGIGATFNAKHFTQPAIAQASKSAADIALGREGQLDNLVLGGTGLMTAPDTIAMGNRGQGMAQQQQTWQQNFDTARAQEAQNQQAMDRINQLYGMAGAAGTPMPNIPGIPGAPPAFGPKPAGVDAATGALPPPIPRVNSGYASKPSFGAA